MRKDNNFSQDLISKSVNIGRTTLSDYEREKTDINFDTLEEIAKTCNYKILFVNNKTKEAFEAKELERKDI